MRFYLGSHRAHWLRELNVSLFVSDRVLRGRRTFPRALQPWGLDSGGFTELSTYGEWRTTEREYVQRVRIYEAEIGKLAFASPQDWMCEPWITGKTGKSVREHQRLTIDNFLRLRDQLGATVVPVLQGWEREDYLRHVEDYANVGVGLNAERLVGLGSVCRRQGMREAEDIVVSLASLGLKLHGYGFKLAGLRRFGYLFESADSMAWSYGGRRRGWCDQPSHCANHAHYATWWRSQVLDALDSPQQGHLEMSNSL